MSLTSSSYHAVLEGDNGATLYVGNWASASDAALSATLGAVINCTKATHATLNDANPDKLAFMRIDMPRDGVDKFARSFAFIDAQLQAGRHVLVHCAAGACRSVAIVLYFLMRRNGWSLAQAHAFLKARRPSIAALDEDSLKKYTDEIATDPILNAK